MILETVLKTSILPGLFLALGVLATRGSRSQLKLQSLLVFLCFSSAVYLIKGWPSFPPNGGLSDFQWLALLFLFYSYWRSQLFLSILAFAFLVWPLYQNSGLDRQWLQNGISFWLLTLSVWSFSERQMVRGFEIPVLVCALVTSVAASLFSLFYSSALLAQTFGVFSGLLGFLLLYSLLFKPRFSPEIVSSFLIAFPLVMIASLHLYLNVSPYKAMALALPYLVLAIRSMSSPYKSSAFADALVTGTLAAMSVAWFVYEASQRGPLY